MSVLGKEILTMSITDKFYEIMEKEDCDFDEMIGEVTRMFEKEKKKGNIKDYKHFSDEDVFDSCGLDIYYLSVSWIDNDNQIHIAGASYYSN